VVRVVMDRCLRLLGLMDVVRLVVLEGMDRRLRLLGHTDAVRLVVLEVMGRHLQLLGLMVQGLICRAVGPT
jgi:hypothetical protein